MQRAIAACALYPIYHGIALKEVGVVELLSAITQYLTQRQSDASGTCAEVYKVERIGKLGRICYARVWSGELRRGMRIERAGKALDSLRIKQLLQLADGKLRPTHSIPAGDIAALGGLDEIRIGDMLYSDADAPIEHKPFRLAEPMLYCRVDCDPAQRAQALGALHELADEDPALEVGLNEFTGEVILNIFGEVQREIVEAVLAERFKLHVKLDMPRTIFREQPCGTGEGEIKWNETHYNAALGIRIEPNSAGDIGYDTKVDYGYLLKPFQNAVREAVVEALGHGNYGWQLMGVKAILTWAEYDSVASTPADYRAIAPLAVHRALRVAGSELLEPMLRYSLRVPGEYASRASYDISSMRGNIAEMSEESGLLMLAGEIPLDTSRSYGSVLASYTKGAGLWDVQSAGFQRYPGVAERMAVAGFDPTNIEKYLLQKSGRLTASVKADSH